jgi:transcriptional regulator with XRE-family HTH domain
VTGAPEGQIERLVKARWLAIGLSQTDLADVLGAAFDQARRDGPKLNGADATRLMQVAEALDIPVELFHSHAGMEQEEPDAALAERESMSSLQSLLELRLLRAFHELRDHRTRRTLVYLAEQIVKRQANRGDGRAPDDAG